MRSAGSGSSPEYLGLLTAYLADAFATLVLGELQSATDRRAAEATGLFGDGLPITSVLTRDSIGRYLPTIDLLGRITYDYVLGKLGEIQSFLRSTTSGRQGVPVENMTLHGLALPPTGVARELYASGVLTDAVPETGLITLFYANDIEALSQLFD